MTHPTRRSLLVLAAALAVPAGWYPARAAPRRYALDRRASRVGFSVLMNNVPVEGTMPVAAADIVIDIADLAASRVDVTLDVTAARTGLPFATEALKAPAILDADRFPTIRFVSTSVRLSDTGRLSDGARLRGRLTIRDVTHPVTFLADLNRPPGTTPDALDRLSVRLQGTISRAAFGATGYAGMVADAVALDIRATIDAT